VRTAPVEAGLSASGTATLRYQGTKTFRYQYRVGAAPVGAFVVR
jgi:hypothetical protein